MGEQRALNLERLDQVMPEVDRLLQGHETLGNWSLGQICRHLALSVQYSVDGFPRRAPWIMRRSLGPVVLGKVLKARRIRAGFKSPEYLQPNPGLDARAEAEALRAAIHLFNARPAQAGFAEHPFFGRMTKSQWTDFHGIHCAHHLSFARPTSAS